MTDTPDDLARTLADEMAKHRKRYTVRFGHTSCACLTGEEHLKGRGDVHEAHLAAHLAFVVSRRDADLRTRIEERLWQLTRFVNVRRNWPDPINDDFGRGIERAVTDIRQTLARALDADSIVRKP